MFTESSPLLRCVLPALSCFKLARSPFSEDKHEIRKYHGLVEKRTMQPLRFFSFFLATWDSEINDSQLRYICGVSEITAR